MALDQHRVQGFGEGLPNTAHNARVVELTRGEVAGRWRRPVHVITPEEQTVYRGAKERSILPPIGCAALFLANAKTRPDSDGLWRSSLAVLWYQHAFALPIAPEILEQLSRLDWESIAMFSRVDDA